MLSTQVWFDTVTKAQSGYMRGPLAGSAYIQLKVTCVCQVSPMICSFSNKGS